MWKPGFDGGFNQTFDLQVGLIGNLTKTISKSIKD
jgi:hypothetical protein